MCYGCRNHVLLTPVRLEIFLEFTYFIVSYIQLIIVYIVTSNIFSKKKLVVCLLPIHFFELKNTMHSKCSVHCHGSSSMKKILLIYWQLILEKYRYRTSTETNFIAVCKMRFQLQMYINSFIFESVKLAITHHVLVVINVTNLTFLMTSTQMINILISF